jgi:hypothetical protein
MLRFLFFLLTLNFVGAVMVYNQAIDWQPTILAVYHLKTNDTSKCPVDSAKYHWLSVGENVTMDIRNTPLYLTYTPTLIVWTPIVTYSDRLHSISLHTKVIKENLEYFYSTK